jgi:hypothetical protein
MCNSIDYINKVNLLHKQNKKLKFIEFKEYINGFTPIIKQYFMLNNKEINNLFKQFYDVYSCYK